MYLCFGLIALVLVLIVWWGRGQGKGKFDEVVATTGDITFRGFLMSMASAAALL